MDIRFYHNPVDAYFHSASRFWIFFFFFYLFICLSEKNTAHNLL